jgi:hypothetical protein
MRDPDIDAAWRAFAKGDAQMKAPARIRVAVLAAWDAAPQDQTPAGSARSYWMVSVAAIAAALLVAVAGLTVREKPQGPGRDTMVAVPAVPVTAAIAPPDAFAPPEMIAGPPPVIRDAAPRVRLERTRAADPVDPPMGMVRLIADRTFETESLRIVRVRVPRASLEALGVALLEPDTATLVDVELVVGDDGLPRQVRRILPVR